MPIYWEPAIKGSLRNNYLIMMSISGKHFWRQLFVMLLFCDRWLVDASLEAGGTCCRWHVEAGVLEVGSTCHVCDITLKLSTWAARSYWMVVNVEVIDPRYWRASESWFMHPFVLVGLHMVYYLLCSFWVSYFLDLSNLTKVSCFCFLWILRVWPLFILKIPGVMH